MIHVNCAKCGQELTGQGGLLFGPPQENYSHKVHLCIDCYRVVVYFITGLFPMVDEE